MLPNPASPTVPTDRFSTLIELLHWRASAQPDQTAYTFLIDGKTEGPSLTYSELDILARAIAAKLQQHHARGERGLLLYPQGLDVIGAFCGCLYSGVIAIPVPPPESGRLKRTLPRLRAIVQDAKASFVLTTGQILSLIETVREDFPEFEEMEWFDTEQVDLELAEKWQDPQVDGEELAYLQYTSGSTSTPKGVMLSHKNLVWHEKYLNQACGYGADSVTITWMPYFHDYGLVEGLIQPLYNGTPCYVMSPFSFIKQPMRWLEAIAKYKGTHSQAPNFAYDLCVRRAKPKQLETLDLSSWQAAGNAAEPINPKVMEKFVETFAPCGFSWHTFAPAYGLAEYTLLVSAKPLGAQPVLCTLDATALERNQIVVAKADAELVRTMPGCGKLVCNTQIAIADPDKKTKCAPNEVGEIWVKDPSVAKGYWERTEETTETFQAYLSDTGEGPFLRTGDLGFVKDGELFITGRIKDLIIIRGTNHYPQDIEWTVQQVHPALRPDYGATFSIEVGGEEKLVILQEVERRTQDVDFDTVIADIRQAVAEDHELTAYAVVLVKPGNILKTSSGKIQRRAGKASFLAGELEVVADWSENPKLTAKYRELQGAVDSLAQQVHQKSSV
ncbi:MAG TPA: AMP-dependent synthetase [Cyanobacteria bacterium UBA11149]|nr:AMP-dependent synthetase [Cyanobacteria bacterium UBA11367]HBE59246.1 AMP-dependent synthetase [Cyanobacteria bacterium UBA11366]HBK62928.1 AMP-dependent synthetase [Cyanobacteria bacterium UBA11166]HBR76864.1 AMP-dependent synthetase [Cyanobacteria bacterium UBA11159]HBS69137.1 AMP-dependent synthetase [Cyanobacteria bacterium UBA11153]HBW88272.1 AMP-dependent synthetase [Cyanobacteria bacterium UBA11149]HCA97134.1 AMP-dependent synthetase [Cyanobacteria bacterium UBA9226]